MLWKFMFPQLFILVNKNEMVLLSYFQLEWMLLYFAVDIYVFLFTTHPKVDWVLKRDLCRAVKELWTWLSLPSYPKPTHRPGSQFNTLHRYCRVSSPVPKQLFQFPGLSLALNGYLVFGWCASICPQGLLPLRPCLCWLSRVLWGCTHPCGHWTPAPWPPAPRPWGSWWSAHHPVSEFRPFGHQEDRSSHRPCWPPDFSSAPRASLSSHCLQLFHSHWEIVQWFVHLMRLILPPFTQGTAGISLFQYHSLLALRKGSKLDMGSMAACDWVKNLYNGRRVRRDGYGWCTRSAWSTEQKGITAMVKKSEAEQGNWTVCSQEVPSHLKDSVILYKKLFKASCKAKEKIKPESTKLQEKSKIVYFSPQFCTKPHSQI